MIMHSMCWYIKLFKAVNFMFAVVILVMCYLTPNRSFFNNMTFEC